MTIETKKARELAQRLKDAEQPIINLSKLLGVKLPDGTLLPEAAALLLALADAHDRMAKDAAMLQFLLGDEDNLTGRFNSIYMRWNGEGGAAGFKAEIQRWVDANAAMGADQRGKE